jgi:2-dehydro-3-deoxyglucarate aldolase
VRCILVDKKTLLKKQPILGSWINSASPIISEIMSASGMDFLVVDAEHSAVNVPQALSLFQAIRAGSQDCVPMVRLPGVSYEEIKRYLDAGAIGVIAPLINTAEDAVELVRSVKYPPQGERGVGFGRSHGYGFNFDAYMKCANEQTVVCVQIEHMKAVENIDEIFAVKGIDAAFIGPYDLSASMGITAEFDHPEYLKTTETIMNKCKEHSIIPGIHVVQPDYKEVLQKISLGFKMIAYSLDITIIGNQIREAVKQIKGDQKDDS